MRIWLVLGLADLGYRAFFIVFLFFWLLGVNVVGFGCFGAVRLFCDVLFSGIGWFFEFFSVVGGWGGGGDLEKGFPAQDFPSFVQGEVFLGIISYRNHNSSD